MKKKEKVTKETSKVLLPAKGSYLIAIETSEGLRWTGPGKDWLVKDREKAQVYKTRNGAERWIAKFAKAQGEVEIVVA